MGLWRDRMVRYGWCAGNTLIIYSFGFLSFLCLFCFCLNDMSTHERAGGENVLVVLRPVAFWGVALYCIGYVCFINFCKRETGEGL
ncbi:hypothetical protein BDR22DRAFT_874191, partial [Usnea florida]